MKRLSINVVLWIVLFTNIGCNKITKFKSKNKYSDSICTEEKENIERETFCKICEKSTKKYCGRCKKVYYCTVLCQKKDWENHKKECKKICSYDEKFDGIKKKDIKFVYICKKKVQLLLNGYFRYSLKGVIIPDILEIIALYFQELPKELSIKINNYLRAEKCLELTKYGLELTRYDGIEYLDSDKKERTFFIGFFDGCELFCKIIGEFFASYYKLNISKEETNELCEFLTETKYEKIKAAVKDINSKYVKIGDRINYFEYKLPVILILLKLRLLKQDSQKSL